MDHVVHYFDPITLAKNLLENNRPIGFLIVYLIRASEWDYVNMALRMENDGTVLEPAMIKDLDYLKRIILDTSVFPLLRTELLHGLLEENVDVLSWPDLKSSSTFQRLVISVLPVDKTREFVERTEIQHEKFLEDCRHVSRLSLYQNFVKEFSIVLNLDKVRSEIWEDFEKGRMTFQIIFDYFPEITDVELLEQVVNHFSHFCYGHIQWLCSIRLDFCNLLARTVIVRHAYRFRSIRHILIDSITSNDNLFSEIIELIRKDVVYDIHGMVNVLEHLLKFGTPDQIEEERDLFLRFYTETSILEKLLIDILGEIDLAESLFWYENNIPPSPRHLGLLLSFNRMNYLRRYSHIFDNREIIEIFENAIKTGQYRTVARMISLYDDLGDYIFPEADPDDECIVCKDDIEGLYMVCDSAGEHHIHLSCWNATQEQFGTECMICKESYYPQIYRPT